MATINLIPEYDTKLFSDIWGDVESFITDYNASGVPATITEANARILYYLICSKYQNNPIANYDENQFKLKMFTIIWQYGPTWEKRLAIQDSLRNLSDDDLMTGAKQIFNHAMNPATEPATGDLEELDYINDQNTSNYKRGKLEAYGTLWELLKVDVTNEFLNKFTACFKKFVRPAKTYIYVTDDEED